MRSEQESRDAIRAWAASKARTVTPGQITDTTPLFRDGYLISLHIPELLLLLERLRSKPVDPSTLGPGDFEDIETIVRRFCTPASGA